MDSVQIHSTPLNKKTESDLINLWAPIFPSSSKGLINISRGQETAFNRDIFFLTYINGELAGSTRLTISKQYPNWAGLGEVVTQNKYRGRGIAANLCKHAINYFKNEKGECIFLGTHNQTASRVYEKLGWVRLANSHVYVLSFQYTLPEIELLNLHKSQNFPPSFEKFANEGRIPIIPLTLFPHPYFVLDYNLNLFSRRHVLHKKCMSILPHFEDFISNGGEILFIKNKNKIEGLLSISKENNKRERSFDVYAYNLSKQLLQDSYLFISKRFSTSKIIAMVEKRDIYKNRLFNEIGFTKSNDLQSKEIEGLKLQFFKHDSP